MATLHREQRLAASAERVWDGVRDIGALHTKLVPGFVLDTELDGEARIVHFANGQVLREPILSIDEARRESEPHPLQCCAGGDSAGRAVQGGVDH